MALTSPVPNFALVGPPSLLHSPGCLGPATAIVDFLHLDILSPLRASAQLTLLPSAPNLVHMGALPALQRHSRSRMTLPTCSLVRISLSMVTLDLFHLGSSVPSRQPVWLEVPLSLSGAACMSVISSVPNLFYLSTLLLPQNSAHLGLVLPVTDFLHPSASLPPQSSACMGTFISAACEQIPSSLLLLQSLGCMGTTVFVSGLPCSDMLATMLDFLHSSFLVLLKGAACLALCTFASEFAHAEATMLPQQFVHSGAILFLCGTTCFGSMLFSLDFVQSGMTPTAKGSAYLKMVSTILDLIALDVPSSSQGASCLELTLPALGTVNLGLMVTLQQSCHTGSTMAALGIPRTGSCAFLLDRIGLGSLSSMHGLVCMFSVTTMLDFFNPGLALALQSHPHLGFAVSALSFAHLNITIPLHFFSRVSMSAVPSNLFHLGFLLLSQNCG